MLGQVCEPPPPPPPGSTTLVNSTFAMPPFFIDFNPTEVGKTISVSVSGNVTGSRIVVDVEDPNGNKVMLLNNPTTNTSTGTFICTSTGAHLLLSNEIGMPSATYSLTITQN